MIDDSPEIGDEDPAGLGDNNESGESAMEGYEEENCPLSDDVEMTGAMEYNCSTEDYRSVIKESEDDDDYEELNIDEK